MGTPDSVTDYDERLCLLWSHQRHHPLLLEDVILGSTWHMTLCWLEWRLCDLMYRLWDWHITSDHQIPGHWDQARDIVCGTQGHRRHNWRNFSLSSYGQSQILNNTMNRSNKCRADTDIVFIWMFVGETHLSKVGASLWVAGARPVIMLHLYHNPPVTKCPSFRHI